MKKRLLSMLMALCMLASLFPTAAFADEPIQERVGEESVEGNEALGTFMEPESPEIPEDPVHMHAYVPSVIAPTCTEQGYTVYTCACGDSYVADYTDALNHSQTIDIAEIPATCTTDGVSAGKQCALCGQIVEGCQPIPALGHSPIEVAEVPATETSTGTTAGTQCAICGEILSGFEVIPVLQPATAEIHSNVEPNEILPVNPTDGENNLDNQVFQNSPAGVQNSPPPAEVTKVTVAFDVTPADASIIVYSINEYGEKTEFYPEEDGAWHLVPGEYFYILKAEGYVSIEEQKFEIAFSKDTLLITAKLSAVTNEEESKMDGQALEAQIEEETAEYSAKNDAIANGTCGDSLFWSLDADGTLLVSGSGEMTNYEKTAPWDSNASLIRAVEIENGVTSIGNRAFSGCRSLVSVTIPTSVVSVGSSAFTNCISLSSIDIPESVTIIGNDAFNGCISLTTITIPESVEEIAFNTFYGCSELTSVILPENTTTIGHSAFYGCNSLSKIIIPEGTKNIGLFAFSGCNSLKTAGPIGSRCNMEFGWTTIIPANAFRDFSCLSDVTIPNGVTDIGYEAFANCSSMERIVIPEGVTSIGNGAFYGCSSLANITIPESVANIGSSAFMECSSLMSAGPIGSGCNIEYGWKTMIPAYAFEDCNSLTTVILPESITTIGFSAFSGCSGLTSITIPENVTSISSNAFKGCNNLKTAGPIGSGCNYEYGWKTSIPAFAFDGCSELISITIPESIKSIGSSAFSRCRKLISAGPIDSGCSIQYGWKDRIPQNAFNGCSGLTQIILPESLTSIESSAFRDCSSLTQISIPEGVTNIGNSAFEGCHSLTSAGPLGSGCNIEYGWRITIPKNAFRNSSLVSIQISEDISSIETSAFRDCSYLKNITIPENVSSISMYAFVGCDNLKTAGPTGSGCDYEYGWKTIIPSNAFYGCIGLTSIIFPDNLSIIDNSSFYGCSSLESIAIPPKTTWICFDAFRDCSSLTSITIPENVTSISSNAFKGCNNLKTAGPIGSGCNYEYGWKTTIPSNAFEGCSGLLSIVIPQSIELIGTAAFDECSALNDVYYLGTVDDWNTIAKGSKNEKLINAEIHIDGVSAFGSCGENISWVLTTDGVLTVTGTGNMTEYLDSKERPWNEASTKIESIIFDNGITSISSNAFYDCSNLKRITIPASIISIGESAFDECNALKDVYYLGTVGDWNTLAKGKGNENLINAEIHIEGVSAFGSCGENLNWVLSTDGALTISGTGDMKNYTDTDLAPWLTQSGQIESVVLSSGVLSIGNSAFLNCPKLISITIPESITSIGSMSFYGCSSLESITIPQNVTDIGESTFSNCNKLVSAGPIGGGYDIEFGWTEVIPQRAFHGCNSLTSIVIPEEVENIGGYAFAGCINLKNITIPDGVTRIEDATFFSCGNLTNINIPDSVTRIAQYAFSDCSNLTNITIPDNLTDIGNFAFYR